MADDGSKQGRNWPLPKFHFEVEFGDGPRNKALFQEITGMEAETDIIEYRDGNSTGPIGRKLPRINKYGNITMKRGVFDQDSSFFSWMNQVTMNTIPRKSILIKLIDENGQVVIEWSVINAWPLKITTTDLKSDGNEVAIESIEIAYEYFNIIKPKG